MLPGARIIVMLNTMLSRLNSAIPPELMADLLQAAERAAAGTRDPEAAKKACDEADRIREEIRAEHGVLDIGRDAIRELRDE
jgi:hypothetical protein